MGSQLIYTFFRHPSYGLSLDAYLVELLPKGAFSYKYKRVIFERLDDYNYPFSENDRKIIRKISELSPRNIEANFNKKKLKTDVFLTKLSEDKTQMKLLASYFDRRLAACLDLLKGGKVYMQQRASDHPGMEELYVESSPAVVTYYFEKQDLGIDYKLNIIHNGQGLPLLGNQVFIITHQPCWLMISGKIYHFDESTDGHKISPFLKSEKLHIPQKLAEDFLQSFMLRASRKSNVEYKGFDILNTPTNTEAVLSIEKDLDGAAVLQLLFNYDRFEVTEATSQDVLVSLDKSQGNFRIQRFQRDELFEETFRKQLKKLGLVRIKPATYLPEEFVSKQKHFSELLDWVSARKNDLEQVGLKIRAIEQLVEYETSVPVLSEISIRENEDWFDLQAIVEINGKQYPFSRFASHILRGERNFKLPDGKVVLLPEEWFTRFADLFEFGEFDDQLLRIHKQHHGLLDGHPLLTMDKGLSLKNNEKQAYLGFSEHLIPAPQGLNANLREYQLKGFQWLSALSSNGLGACLADDMGLGKTLQVIALIQKSKNEYAISSNHAENQQLNLFSEAPGKPSLIVMAPSLIYNWENELRKFAPELHVRKHLGQRRRTDTGFFEQADVILTTYGVVRNDIKLLKQVHFNHVVLDESQLIKNARSVSFQSVRQLNARQRIVLTGTPVENSLTDLWAQLTFLQPGLLGSQKFFKQEFVQPIEQQQDNARLEKLRKIIHPFILRRTKEEVSPELPELSRRIHYCEMLDEHRSFYEEQKSNFRNRILESVSRSGVDKNQLLILRGLSHLRQIAIHPGLINPEFKGDSGKTDQVKFTLSQLKASDKKVLLFSPFVRHLSLYKEHFQTENQAYSYLTGEVPQHKRGDVIGEFDLHKGHRSFLIQLKAGGSGLNLTMADHVFLLDPWWNPAAEEQAIARAHRMGQKMQVFAWRFITKDSIEEKILRLQEKKSRLASDIMQQSALSSHLSKEDLDELFA
jgi:SNF2 family DNA or RNA helicase